MTEIKLTTSLIDNTHTYAMIQALKDSKLQINHDTDAGTCIARTPKKGRIVFRALRKDRNTWIVSMDNRLFTRVS